MCFNNSILPSIIQNIRKKRKSVLENQMQIIINFFNVTIILEHSKKKKKVGQ